MVLTFYRAGRKRLFNGIFDNSTVSACNQPEICDAHSSDLGECSGEPAADPSATSFLPCFQTAKPSPKKGPMSTTKKANKNSTKKRRTITMAGIGFPRSHLGTEFSSPLAQLSTQPLAQQSADSPL